MLERPLNVLRRIKHGAWRRWRNLRRAHALQRLRGATRGRVASGPFAGLVLDSSHVFGAAGAKLLGTYEAELTDALDRVRVRAPPIVIDVGGADGYFAVGFAHHWRSPVIVFERLAHAREIISRNSALNGVCATVDLRGDCDEAALYTLLMQHPRSGFLMMDVEGAELDLISARIARALSGWPLLIECHDFARQGCTRILEQRLAPTHCLQRISSRPRQRADFPLALMMSQTSKLELMDEGRPGVMTSLLGWPRKAGAA